MEKKQITPEIEGGIKSAMDEPLSLQPTRYSDLSLTVRRSLWGRGPWGPGVFPVMLRDLSK